MEVLVYENCLSILYLCMYVLGHSIKMYFLQEIVIKTFEKSLP